MKDIQSINVWKDGTVKTATKIKVTTVFDDLETMATFFYQLIDTANSQITPIAEGSVRMLTTEYTAWDRSVNDTYSYIADKLSLTLLP